MELSFKVPGFPELACDLGLGDPTSHEHLVDQMWRYRRSHGDLRALKSGLESRLYGAARLSFPLHRAQAAVMKVLAISIYSAYSSQMLMALLTKHARKFPIVHNHIFLSCEIPFC